MPKDWTFSLVPYQCPSIILKLGLPAGEVTKMHNRNNQLHDQKALVGAAVGAATGYSREGREGAAAGAVIGGLAALIAGNQAVNAL